MNKLVNQPKNLKVKLFDHQLASIYNMEKLEREKMVEVDDNIKETILGINADITGFGKTLSIIGLIIRDKMEWDLDNFFISEKIESISLGIIKHRKIKRYKKKSTNLILASSSILSQWKRELKHSDLKFETICSRKDIETINIDEYHVILVIPSMYNNLVKTYSKYAWKRFIFDEPGHTRVPSMKEIVAGFYWFVTATPNAITSYHRNCRGSFMKDILGDSWVDFENQFENMIVKNNPDFIKESFSMPKIYNYYYKCYQPILKVISGLADKNINDMLEADNIEGVINLLGGKKCDNIIELVKEKKLIQLEQIENKVTIYKRKKDEKNEKIWENKKQHVLYQIKELKNRFYTMIKGVCCICMENLKDPVLETNCQNLFCGKCLLKSMSYKKNCPTCRAQIEVSDIIYLSSKNNDLDMLETDVKNIENDHIYTKLQKTIELLTENSKDKKFLIFSNYNNTFKPICKVLSENIIDYRLIKGSSSLRETSINEYKTGNIKVIFLNSDYNGAGINLQETTDIIFYHNVSNYMKEQIIGRAQRIGSDNILSIHYLEANI